MESPALGQSLAYNLAADKCLLNKYLEIHALKNFSKLSVLENLPLQVQETWNCAFSWSQKDGLWKRWNSVAIHKPVLTHSEHDPSFWGAVLAVLSHEKFSCSHHEIFTISSLYVHARLNEPRHLVILWGQETRPVQGFYPLLCLINCKATCSQNLVLSSAWKWDSSTIWTVISVNTNVGNLTLMLSPKGICSRPSATSLLSPLDNHSKGRKNFLSFLSKAMVTAKYSVLMPCL